MCKCTNGNKDGWGGLASTFIGFGEEIYFGEGRFRYWGVYVCMYVCTRNKVSKFWAMKIDGWMNGSVCLCVCARGWMDGWRMADRCYGNY